MKKIFIIHILLALPLLAWCDNITFADAEVKAICVKNWDTNGDGELSKEEAAAVNDLGRVFERNTSIKSFDELQFFTGLTTMWNSEFYGCTGLVSIAIPNSVTTILSCVFQDCSALKSFSFSDGLTYIGSAAFDHCTSLTSVTIPDNVKNISYGAFSNCSALTSFTLGSGVEAVDNWIVNNCNRLTKIVVRAKTPPDASLESFTNRKNLSLYVPKGSKAAYQAADHWKEFKEIVEYDGDENINFADAEVKAICVKNWDTNGDGELSKAEAAAVKDLGDVFNSNKSIKSFDEFQYFKGISIIGSSTFGSCSGLTSITIPSSVTSIADGAFYACSGLTSITIPNSVTSIGEAAFQNCLGLTSIIIPSSVTSIGEFAFASCSGLTSITIPSSVTSIGNGFFYECSSLTSIIIPSSVTSIGNNAFTRCSSLKSITIPNSVTSIGNGAFGLCTSLTNIIIPNSVTTIGSSAFYGCTGLTSFTIPNSVTEIHMQAFQNCTSLTSIAIPNGVKQINHYTFAGCTALTSVTIPNSMTRFGPYVFQNCSSLTSITIPNSVTEIEGPVFDGCSKLISVKVEMTNPVSIVAKTFSNRANATLYVPKGSKAAYQAADYWKEFKTILEFPDTDVNQDGATDVVDVVDIARYVVGSPSDSFHEFLADLNSDDKVNVADAVVLVNDIAGNTSFAKVWNGSHRSGNVDERLLLTENKDHSLSLCMDNSRAYTAFQFDLMMNNDMNVMKMLLNDSRKNGHQLLYNKVGDGHYRVVALSTANNSFNGKNGELLNIQLDGFDTDDLTIHNVHFFTGQGNDYAFDDLKLQGGTTAIEELPLVEGGQPAAVYDLQGRKQPTLRRGVNIINGKKVIIK